MSPFVTQKLDAAGRWRQRRGFGVYEVAQAFVEAHVSQEGGRWRIVVPRAHRGIGAGSILWRTW